MTSTVALTDIRKEFKGTHGTTVKAVDGIDLSIERGEIVALLGPNGAGKTTTIDIILGLTSPTTGSVKVGGKHPRRAVEAGEVSAVLQTGGLLRDLTVKETLTAIAALHGKPERVSKIVEKTGLEQLLDRKVSKCSGGEQQRLKFALALLPDPQLLILDEPTAGMDVTARRDFWATMRADADSGRTIIFATHYLEEAEQFSQRTVLVNKGRIVADGPTAQIRAVAAGRVVMAGPGAGAGLGGKPEVGLGAGPDDPGLAATLAELRRLDGVQTVELNGHRVVVTTLDSDGLARKLLTTYNARDLEISAPSLESAFLDLTSQESEDRAAVSTPARAAKGARR
ncbi:ABC transporter ATP-binding protein [Timonella senegalensis]|uniref:ABC transporter ATP-binding protein n=1 Tax=Timonella senegalensis TaxID=1465825 RepID=UPI0028A9DC57|nr:ABC transporter ATP-binding protein [Timonella senegalensis]